MIHWFKSQDVVLRRKMKVCLGEIRRLKYVMSTVNVCKLEERMYIIEKDCGGLYVQYVV